MEEKSRLKIFDRDTIKYIALIPMFLGHLLSYIRDPADVSSKPLWYTFIEQTALFAPPVFFFFITDGFRYTRSKKKYALRLLIFALVTQIPFTLANHGTLLTGELFLNWNIIFTLFLALLSLMVWESGKKLPLRIALIVLLDGVTFMLTSEWMIFGILTILGLHIFREKPKVRLIWFTVCVFAVEMISNGILFPFWLFWRFPAFTFGMMFLMLAYFVMTKCYNGQKGKHPVFAKWFFYIFYPAHLLVIWIVKLCLGIF